MAARGKVTAPIFLLVPQVKRPKRLDLARDAERAVDGADRGAMGGGNDSNEPENDYQLAWSLMTSTPASSKRFLAAFWTSKSNASLCLSTRASPVSSGRPRSINMLKPSV